HYDSVATPPQHVLVVDNFGVTTGVQVNIHADQTATSSVASPTFPEFLSFCVARDQSVASGDVFPVDQDEVPPVTAPPASAANWGRIAYLSNHYGTSLLSPIDAAGLQVAIWELANDIAPLTPTPLPDLSAGNYQFTLAAQGDTDVTPQVTSSANNYFAAS